MGQDPKGGYTRAMSRSHSARREAIEVIQKLPVRASWDDIMYGLYVRRKIAEGITAADEGRVFAHEDVRRTYLKSR